MFTSVSGQDTFLPLLKDRPKPFIDGVLSEKEWSEGARANRFFTLRTGNPARVPTSVSMYHDAEFIYFGIECMEPAMDRISIRRNIRDFGVWEDDCVEIFLAPSGNAETYWQFIVTAGNVQGDLKCGNGGRDSRWNGEWKSAVKRGIDRWTVEAAIPIALFGKPKGNTWRVAVARENHASKELSSWPFLGMGFHNPSRFAILNGVHYKSELFRYDIESVVFAHPKDKDGMVSGVLKVVLASASDGQEKIKLKITDGKEFQYFEQLKTDLKAGGNTLEFPITVPASGKYAGTLKFENGTVLGFEFKADAAPLEAGIFFPRYRNYIFDSMNLTGVKVEIRPIAQSANGGKMVLTLKGPDGRKVGEAREYPFPDRPEGVDFPLPKLDFGKYNLELKYGNFTQTFPLEKIRPAVEGPSVWFDENNVLVVNGEKVFPFGFYWGPPAVENYTKSGFNSVIETGGHSAAAFSDNQKFYDQHGIYSFGVNRHLFGLSRDSGKIGRYAVEQASGIFRVRSKMLCGWYTADEPDLQTSNDAFMTSVVSKNRELGGLLPQIIVYNQPSGVTIGNELPDVVAVDPYLGFKRGSASPGIGYERISSSLDSVVKTVGNRRPVWAVLECYPSGYYGNYAEQARYPTIGEIRLMTYLAVVHGAKGVFFWDNSVLSVRKLYPAMKEFAGEFGTLIPFLTVPACDASPVIRNGIHSMERKLGEKIIVIAVNPTAQKIAAEIPVTASGTFHVMSENRTVKAADNVIKDVFPGYGVHIYSNFAEGSAAFAETLKKYRLEDSYIGINTADNLADVWSGAKYTETNRNQYRNGIEPVDGAIGNNWVSNGKPGTYTVKLHRDGAVSRVRLIEPDPGAFFELGRKGIFSRPDKMSVRKFFIYWNDNSNRWEESSGKPSASRSYSGAEYVFSPFEADSIRISNLHKINEIQVFEK